MLKCIKCVYTLGLTRDKFQTNVSSNYTHMILTVAQEVMRKCKP